MFKTLSVGSVDPLDPKHRPPQITARQGPRLLTVQVLGNQRWCVANIQQRQRFRAHGASKQPEIRNETINSGPMPEGSSGANRDANDVLYSNVSYDVITFVEVGDLSPNLSHHELRGAESAPAGCELTE